MKLLPVSFLDVRWQCVSLGLLSMAIYSQKWLLRRGYLLPRSPSRSVSVSFFPPHLRWFISLFGNSASFQCTSLLSTEPKQNTNTQTNKKSIAPFTFDLSAFFRRRSSVSRVVAWSFSLNMKQIKGALISIAIMLRPNGANPNSQV